MYLDHNASTPVHPRVLELYLKVSQEVAANPSSLHRPGRRAQGILEQARERIGHCLQLPAKEILFTGGATEGNNIALFGAVRAMASLHGTPIRMLASAAEHPAVLGALRLLQQEGHPLRLLPLDRHGRVQSSALGEALAEEVPTVLALQWANNETGAIQDFSPWLETTRSDLHLHVDAVQGFGKLPWPAFFQEAPTFVGSGHKFRGPKGFGFLRVADFAFLQPMIGGGGQQGGLRPGTESPAGALATALALELAFEEQASFERQSAATAQAFLKALEQAGVSFESNHPPLGEGLPNTLNLSFPGIDGRKLLPACDAEDLALSSGSACASGSAQASPVLLASGVSEALARASLRISFGWQQGPEEGRAAGRTLTKILQRIYQN